VSGTEVETVALRPFRYDGDEPHPGDVAAAQQLMIAYDLAILGERDAGDDEARALLTNPLTLRDESCLLVVGDEPVGFVWLENDVTARDVFVDVWVPPGPHRSAALELGVGHGLAVGHRIGSTSGTGWDVRAGNWLQDEDFAEALALHGFEQVRRFYRMRIDATSPVIPATAPALPDGVEIVVPRDEDGYRATCLVDNESFLDHWHFTPREYDEWWILMTAEPGYDPEAWWLVLVDGEPAAICLNDESRADLGDGYVGVLGVRRQFRGRGLATLLLQHAFVRDRDRGRRGTQLMVDAENWSGAVRLYERVGMTASQIVQGWAVSIT
jgi:ribosomal protein S18 acetylase RimI-like enzyme